MVKNYDLKNQILAQSDSEDDTDKTVKNIGINRGTAKKSQIELDKL